MCLTIGLKTRKWLLRSRVAKRVRKYLRGVLYFTTEDKSGSLRTLSRSVTLRVLSIPRWALGDRMMLRLEASHSEIPEMNLGTRKPELYELREQESYDNSSSAGWVFSLDSPSEARSTGTFKFHLTWNMSVLFARQLDQGTVGLPLLRSSAECPASVADLIPISGSQEICMVI